MIKLSSPSVTMLALAFMAGVASAQSDNPWNGFYAGVNAGGTRNNACTSSTLSGPMDHSMSVPNFSNCPGGDSVGGLQIGENFQIKRLFWGVGADLDIWNAKDDNQSSKVTGVMFPAGTYAFSGKFSPSNFIVIGPRIGYAGDLWLPYFRAGAIITTGSRDSTLSYAPTGATKPAASFGAGKNFTSSGWAAGGGVEIGLNGAWSITAEYLHVNLGKGLDSTATCSGSVSACAAFSGISFDSIHNNFTANIFRVGINYWFGYWGP
jgi:outer membrane immunogenic protein